jgi:hypothetical protein
MAAKRRTREYPKPPLTIGGRQRADLRSDAPKPLQALALAVVPGRVKGPAMRGAFARGWTCGVRERKATENPYRRAGSGFHHAMATLFAEGWIDGIRVARIDTMSGGMTEREYEKHTELRERVRAILHGEIVSGEQATRKLGSVVRR